jgi:rRNA biogenesis protein RRP5
MPRHVTTRHILQVGQSVTGRVLNVDVAAKKLSMTLKPALLGSKLPPLTSALQAAPGVKAHGVVTGFSVRNTRELACAALTSVSS